VRRGRTYCDQKPLPEALGVDIAVASRQDRRSRIGVGRLHRTGCWPNRPDPYA
jgi:hypothetical protein